MSENGTVVFVPPNHSVLIFPTPTAEVINALDEGEDG